MKMVKFIKVNLVIANIVLGIYQLITLLCAAFADYSSDKQLALIAAGVVTISILVTNFSGKMLIKIFSKVYGKK